MVKITLNDKVGGGVGIIVAKAQPLIKALCINVEKFERCGREQVVFEVPTAYVRYFKIDLCEQIAKYILFTSKLNFYQKQLLLDDDMIGFATLRALVFAEFDEEIAKLTNKIGNFDCYSLDGISNFLLNEEMDEWMRVVDEFLFNVSLVPEKEIMPKFHLKCITTSIPFKEDTLYMMEDTPPYLTTDHLDRKEYTFKDYDNVDGERELLAMVLEYFPKQLVMYPKNLSKELNQTLTMLFDKAK